MKKPIIAIKPKKEIDLLGEAKTLEEFKKVMEAIVNDLESETDAILLETMNTIQEAQKDSNNLQTETIKELFTKYTQRMSVLSGHYVEWSVHKLDSESVGELRRQLCLEFSPVTPSEALVIDQAVNAYFRSLRLSGVHISVLQDRDGTTSAANNQTMINFLKDVGKQACIANQQFMTAITYLREAKLPPIKVSVHAKEAFVANNQQFNKNA